MVVDGVRHLSGGNALLAYGTVFVLESLLLLFTLTLTRGLRVGVALSSEMRAAAARHLWEEFTPAGR
jgi:hypothetical protein